MNGLPTSFAPPMAPRASAWRATLGRFEQSLLFMALAGIVLLPVIEVLLRRAFSTGVGGSAALVQHLALVAGMLGGAFAASTGKLLCLFDVTANAGPRLRHTAGLVRALFTACVCTGLASASLDLLRSEWLAGSMVALGIPVWLVQSVMPLGFALIGLRQLWHECRGRRRPFLGLLLVTALLCSVWAYAGMARDWTGEFAVALALCAVCGAPVFAVIGGLALLLFASEASPLASIALDHYRLVVNPSLPAVPLFTLAGFIMASGGAPTRLTTLFQALFGHLRGGVGVAAIVAGAFFTAFTGASGVTILALGGILLPLLLQAGFAKRDALGMVTVSGSLGVLLPPCLPLILIALVARIDLRQMFLAALVPGLLTTALVALWCVQRAPAPAGNAGRFNAGRARRALAGAAWDLGLPLVALGALASGWATPVEAAALTVCYALGVESVVFKNLRRSTRLIELACDCGAMFGSILLILGVSMGLTNYLVDIELAEHAVDWLRVAIPSQWMFLLALNAALLLVGCLMDIFSAIVVVVPLVLPLAIAFGVEPAHAAVIVLANLELGYLTPPVGINLFYASSRFNKPIAEVCRSVLPLLPVMAVGVLLVTYLPQLSTALPQWLK